jgi:hypothetical protein
VYVFENRLGIIQDSVIPVPGNPVPQRFQECSTALVVFCRAGMQSAIRLDDQTFLLANKIHDIWPDNFLTPEFETSQSVVGTEVYPEQPFSIRSARPENPGQWLQVHYCFTALPFRPLPFRAELPNGLAQHIRACRGQTQSVAITKYG